jgi:hypothetical protein
MANAPSRGTQSPMIHVTYRDKHIYDNDHDLWYLRAPGPDSVEYMIKAVGDLVGWDELTRRANKELGRSDAVAEDLDDSRITPS